MLTGMRFDPQVPGERSNLPAQAVPQFLHLLSSVRRQAVISYQSRPMSSAWHW